MSKLKELDRPPPGWFVLDVIREKSRTWVWVALMLDIDPEEHRLGRPGCGCWVRIPGKHKSRDAACDALQDMMATRH